MKINHKIVAEHLGVPLRGNETFDELLEIESSLPKHNSLLSEGKNSGYDDALDDMLSYGKK